MLSSSTLLEGHIEFQHPAGKTSWVPAPCRKDKLGSSTLLERQVGFQHPAGRARWVPAPCWKDMLGAARLALGNHSNYVVGGLFSNAKILAR